MKIKNLKLKIRKTLSVILVILIVLSSIKFLILKPKVAFASSTLGFNEGYGTTINDNNGSITGTITNAVWKQEDLCKFGKCLYFDGTGDYVNFGDDADLDHIAADNFTIEGWFRTPDITSGTRVLTAKYNSATGSDGGYKVYMDSNGYLIFGIDDDQTSFPEDSVSTTNTAFDDNKWHYFSAVKSGTSSITIYVDGNQYQTDSSISSTGTLANTDSFYLGIDGDGSSNGYVGFLDEVTMHNTARSAAEIKTDFASETPSRGSAAVFSLDQSHLSDGLIGYWKMDESSGNASDSSGNNFTLTNNGTTGYGTGKFGKGAGAFNGSSKYFSTATSVSNIYSVSLWVYPTSTTNSYFNLASGIYVNSSSGTISATGFTNPTIYINGAVSSVIAANAWQMITVTDTSPITANVIEIGRANGSYFANNGYLDEVRFYNKILSPADVSSVYNFAPGPVGYWKMDEGIWTNDCSTSTVIDSSTNGYAGKTCPSSTGPTNTSTGKLGAAGNLDGTNDYVDIGDSFYTDSLTISAWINLRSLSASQRNIVVKRNGSAVTAGTNEYELSINSTGKLVWQTWDSGGSGDLMTSTSTLSVNTWYHVAISYPGNGAGNANMYINGVLDKQQSFAYAIVDSSSRIQIGARSGSNDARYFNGYIDDAKIYNYARTAGQVVEDMNGGHPAPGSPIGSSVAYWKLDEGYGTTAHDQSLNTNDLTLSSATLWTNSGKFGKAFNGQSNARLSRADDSDFDFLGDEDFSFSLWFKSDSTTNPSANEYLLQKGGNIATDAIGYAIYSSSTSDGLICFGIDDDATSFPEDSVCSTNDLYDGAWHHIVARKTGTTRLDLFIDGKTNGTPDTSISATGTLANSSTFYIGDTNGTDGTDEFLGDIDEIQVYRKALSNESILTLFNQASASLGASSTDSSNIPSNSDENTHCPPGQGSTCVSPVGYWKLDENTGLTAFDTGTNKNDGTISTTSNPPKWGSGVFGSALRFPGTSGADAVSMGDPASLDFGTNSFTLQFWMKVEGSTGTTQIPIYKGGPSSTTVGYDFEINSSNVLKWHYGDGTAPNYVSLNVIDNISPFFNKWVFVTSVVDRSNNISSVYFNGSFVASTSISGYGSVDNTRNFQLGNYHSGTLPFFGSIDEIKVYNYARTSSQIDWDYNRGAPIGWWKLDEGTGTSANDSMGNSTAGTLTNTPTWTTGKINSGISFAGSNQQILVSDDADFDFADDESMSITGWFKHTTASAQEIILSKYAAAGYKVISESDGDITCGLDYDSTWSPTDFATSTLATYDDNSWHHFACVKDGATSLSLYIDGKLITTDSSISATNTLDNSDPLYIGIDADGSSNDFTGSLDDIRIFRYALTAQQIKTIMNNGAAVKY